LHPAWSGRKTSLNPRATEIPWILTGCTTAKEKHELRQTYNFAADLMSYTFKSEISLDGKTWILETESKGTKVKPTQK
jgi:hypothetical protein